MNICGEIITGLGPEFHEILAALWARDILINYAELFDKLLDHKFFLKHEDLKKNSTK